MILFSIRSFNLKYRIVHRNIHRNWMIQSTKKNTKIFKGQFHDDNQDEDRILQRIIFQEEIQNIQSYFIKKKRKKIEIFLRTSVANSIYSIVNIIHFHHVKMLSSNKAEKLTIFISRIKAKNHRRISFTFWISSSERQKCLEGCRCSVEHFQCLALTK